MNTERIAELRIDALNAKFAGKEFTIPASETMEILNLAMSQLEPRVTPEMWKELGRIEAIAERATQPAQDQVAAVRAVPDDDAEAHKLARILWSMVEAVEDYKPTEIYKSGYQSMDGDVFVHRAATLLVEQEADIKELTRYVDSFGSQFATINAAQPTLAATQAGDAKKQEHEPHCNLMWPSTLNTDDDRCSCKPAAKSK